nr:lasso RiPP family leader peptide-containing protein [uncultured Methanobacterium sp.]
MKDKRIYKKPEVEEYGTLKTITQGGTGGNTEGENMTDAS